MNSTIERDYKPDNPTAVTVSEVLAEVVLKRPPLQVLWDHMMTQLECCGVQGYTDFTSQVSFPEQHKVQLVDSLALAPSNSVKKELKCRTMTVHFFLSHS